MIRTERRGDIAILHMVHGKANALDVAFGQALAAAFEAERSSAARAIVLTGQGSMFSAGVDLPRLLEGGMSYARVFMPALHAAFESIFCFPKPVVAAINGHAIAGGCVLACAADYRIMNAEAGRIGLPELLVGVPFPTLALEVMRSAAGAERVSELIYSGRTLSAAEAQARGLVHAVAPASEVLDRAIDAATSLGALAPAAFALTKRQLQAAALERVRADAARFEAEVEAVWASPATHAAIRAYIERTFKPARAP